MTATTHRVSTRLPLSQNTAPVLEFNCLYTHDLRKKRKVWNDGFLRYHTFNKRVMVYDTPGRNFIGDAHWMSSALQSGDEVTLEREGVMVEVADEVGRTQTDLSGLLGPRHERKANENRSSSPARAPQTPMTRTAVRPSTAGLSRQPPQLKHRSLSALLGASKGPIGKAALPLKSPYEQRHEDVETEGWERGPPSKRIRVERPTAKTVHEATITAVPTPARNSEAALPKSKATVHSASPKQTFDLTADKERVANRFLPGFSSDTLAPSTSPVGVVSPRVRDRRKVAQVTERSSSPAFQTQKAAATRRLVVDKQPRRSAQDESGSKSRIKQLDSAAVEKENLPPSKPVGSTLRVASSAPKKRMLVCQDQLVSKPLRTASNNTDDAADTLLGATGEHDRNTEDALERVSAPRRSRVRARTGKEAGELQCDTREPASHTTKADFRSEAAQQVRTADEGKTPAIDSHEGHEAVLCVEQTSAAASDALVSTVSRKKKGVGKREIRDSARACFRKEPATEAHESQHSLDSALQSDGAFGESAEPTLSPSATGPRIADSQTVEVIEHAHTTAATPAATKGVHNGHTSTGDQKPRWESTPIRVTGAPIRFTPSPRKQSPPCAKVISPKPVSSVSSPLIQNNPSPTEIKAVSTSTRAPPAAEAVAAMPPPPKPAPHGSKAFKKPAARTGIVQLNTSANSGTAAVMLGRPFHAPKMAGASAVGGGSAEASNKAVPADVAVEPDPWSREAFDLFDWRPPAWDEERWCPGVVGADSM